MISSRSLSQNEGTECCQPCVCREVPPWHVLVPPQPFPLLAAPAHFIATLLPCLKHLWEVGMLWKMLDLLNQHHRHFKGCRKVCNSKE